jgi:hypothetical protein
MLSFHSVHECIEKNRFRRIPRDLPKVTYFPHENPALNPGGFHYCEIFISETLAVRKMAKTC